MEGSFIKHKDREEKKSEFFGNLANHREALKKVLDILVNPEYGALQQLQDINAVGHRMVHGGEVFTSSALVTPAVMETLKSLIPLAPLHNPANITGIEAVQEVLPGVPNVVVFDTAFFQSMTPEHYLYALPMEYYEKYKIRKYGFHGTSHDYISHRACEILGKDYASMKIISCHVGNGASIACIQNGKALETSLGFTPLEGLIMGTRCGDIDPAIVPFLMKNEGLSADEIDTILNKKSGVLGLYSGKSSDMRDIEEGYLAGKEPETQILKMYVNRIVRYIGGYIALMNGVDVIVMAAGILERSPLTRALIMKQLQRMGATFDETNNDFREQERIITTSESKVTVIVVPTNEEYMIAKDTYELAK
jgi:acetate kinase